MEGTGGPRSLLPGRDRGRPEGLGGKATPPHLEENLLKELVKDPGKDLLLNLPILDRRRCKKEGWQA